MASLRGGLQLPILVVIAVLGCDVSLACTNGDIRLVGGASNLEGRVEICDSNTWGTVCDDGWETVAANVACGQLGFSRSGSTAFSTAVFGQGTGPIFLDDVQCNGTEAQLVNCHSRGIGIHNCVHSEDAGVICLGLNCTDGELRLVNGSNHTEGRVEMCYNAIWGTVCDDLWDSFDASVVCRQLGFFPTGAAAISFAFFGQGNGSIWLDNVECTGNETQLIACSHSEIGSHNCSHSQDASVRCQACTNGDIRLVGGASNLEGRVEICVNATWGTVCDFNWGTADANVACGQLGFSRSGSIPRSFAFFGPRSGPILLHHVFCLGTEAQLVNCLNNSNTFGSCSHNEDVGVTCLSTERFQACYDNTAANCRGNEVTGVSTARECCLGDGYWFQDPNLGGCQQCIVHGFERTVVLVDEGTLEETLVIRMNIKGNVPAEDPQFPVAEFFFIELFCYDVTTERDDYFTDCPRPFLLNPYGPEENFTTTITIPADNDALEGTEVLLLILEPIASFESNIGGNIFFQSASIQINDTTVLRPGFSEEDYVGNEGPDRRSTLPNMPCNVTIRLLHTTIADNLMFRLTPQTISEYTDANGGPPIGALTGANASRMDFNDTQPFEVTMVAGTTVVTADIPIVNDEINEAEECFVVILEVVSNTTNPVDFTTQTTVCRIPASDPVEIGFTEKSVNHTESEANFSAVVKRFLQSEQTFQIQIQISAPRILGLGEPATLGDDIQTTSVLNVTLTPDDDEVEITYLILEDATPESTEIFLVSTLAVPGSPAFDCDGLQDCSPELQVSVVDDDIVTIGFVETLVEVNETDGTAALNVSISSPPSDVALGFEIILLVNSMDGSARSGFCSNLDTSVDFTCISQSLRFEGAQRSHIVLVTIIDDNITEGVEELNVSLSLEDMGLTNSVNVTPAVATVRIQDNDHLEQFSMCYNNPATDCNGTVVPNVTTARDCCLGDGYWFSDAAGQCHQCIVHGFVNTSLMVDEGSQQQTIEIRRDIKGNPSAEPSSASRIDFTVICHDLTTESGDYSTRACNSTARLRQNDTAQVAIDFPQDSVAMEGTESLLMELRLSQEQQSILSSAGNVFIQNESTIQIRDTNNVVIGFSEDDYSGNEGPDRLSPLRNAPCRVVVSLQDITIEAPLTFRLIPQTIPENVNANGPLPTATLIRANASRMDFNDTQPFEVTMAAGINQSEVVTADIPILDDEINEAEEEFVIVLEVVSNTTNSVEFTTQTTVCRIPPSDPIEIGFTQARIKHNETGAQFSAVLKKDRPSEQTFFIQIQLSTPRMQRVGEPATAFPSQPVDFTLANFTLGTRTVIFALTPADNGTELEYTIFEDNIPENTEIFQLSAAPDPNTLGNPDFDCDDDPMFRFNGHDCFPDLQVLILDDDVLGTVGFVETLVEFDESVGQAPLNVRISLNSSTEFEIMFFLLVNTVDDSAGSRSRSNFIRNINATPGIEDYQQIVNNTPGNILPLVFGNTRHLQTFDITIFKDKVPEGVEELNVTLSLQDRRIATQVIVEPAVATVRIRDNDSVVVGFDRTTYMVNETDEQVELCVIVSVPEDQNIGNVTFSLAVETQNGTAAGTADTGDMVGSGTVGFGMTGSGTVGSGADFISVMETLATFSTMQPKQCFNVTIIDDMEVELSEYFFATLTLIPASVTIVDPNRTTIDPLKATVSIMDNDVRMTPVPSAASASLPGSAIPSPSTSPTSSPVASAILWPVLFAPLAVVLLVLLIVVVAAILYYKRRRRFLNLKRGLNREDKSMERLYEANPLARHRPSVQLRRMLPHGMIIPSSVLKLQDSVGQGEFGVVYKANLQWHLDAATEVVAVKTLKGLFTPNDVDNLVQEVLKMHTLSHPNVMTLTGVCLDTGGGPAVVMPFMGRGSVLHYLKKERGKLVPPDDADCSVISDAQTQLLGMCLQISKGMEYLAKERIVHRDLAARNCMMDTGGVIKVADFGLSEDIYTTTYYRQKKSDTAVKLPVRWMPPESIADGMFTEKSDVWSFGITCWEVFTGGHIPYSGISPVALLQLLRNGERLNKPMNPACSDEIYAIMLDCWKEEPKERPDFSKLVETISLTLEAAAGYMELSLCVKDERPPVAAEVEVKTRADDSSVQQETAM